MKRKYIDDDIQKGIDHDWKLIRKEFKKLKIPENVYNPLTLPVDKAFWNLLLSERSKGKTTNLILFGMCMNKVDGTVIEYIRQDRSYISPMRASELFKTILQYDYISKLTDGKWNSVTLNRRKWYYCNRDDDGKEIDISGTHFMSMITLEEAETYKSSYNSPFGDWIIFDEFISRTHYRPNEFIILTDLISTIKRERLSVRIILASNMVDKNSQYFNELEIMDEIRNVEIGSDFFHKTQKGTMIYCQILEQGEILDTHKKESNRLFFGFKNPLIANITGENWSIENYPHIDKYDNKETKSRNHYIFHNEKLCRIDLVQSEKRGLIAEIHWASNLYDDSVIYTIDEILDSRYRYKIGYSKIDKFIWSLYKKNRWFYATNDIGAFIENYVNMAKVIR